MTEQERQQFEWNDHIRQVVMEHCDQTAHPPGPSLIRVYDFMGQEPPVRLKFTSRQCDCGRRLYVDGPVEVKEVKRVSVRHDLIVAAAVHGEERDEG